MTAPAELLTGREVAALLQVPLRTVSRRAREGAVPSTLTPGGHRRYRPGDLPGTWVQHIPGAAAHHMCVVWPGVSALAPADDPERTGYVGCVWQSTPDGEWFAVVGEHAPVGLGSFPTLHAAHLAVRRAAIEARATARAARHADS